VPSLAYISTKADKRPSYALKPETMQRIRAARELAAQGDLQEALRRYNQLLSEEPDNPVALNDAAWFLASTEKPDLRNVPLAIQMASRAVSLTDHRQIEFISALVTGHPDVVEFNRKMTAYYSAGIPTSEIRRIGSSVQAAPER
jgi:Tetratricopeptide repeat